MPTLVETYRATVAPSDCDHLGHMNVQHYFAAVSDGMFAMMIRLGLGPSSAAVSRIKGIAPGLSLFAPPRALPAQCIELRLRAQAVFGTRLQQPHIFGA